MNVRFFLPSLSLCYLLFFPSLSNIRFRLQQFFNSTTILLAAAAGASCKRVRTTEERRGERERERERGEKRGENGEKL
jgi:hypothetical protein